MIWNLLLKLIKLFIGLVVLIIALIILPLWLIFVIFYLTSLILMYLFTHLTTFILIIKDIFKCWFITILNKAINIIAGVFNLKVVPKFEYVKADIDKKNNYFLEDIK